VLAVAALLLTATLQGEQGQPQGAAPKVVLVIHGGAGPLPKAEMTPEREKQYRRSLERSLRAGLAALQRKHGTSLDAVEAAIRVLEDDPLFNAGRGAVFTHEGRNELDASIMEGKDRRAGAVAGVSVIKNPISAARAVMEKSPHVLLAGRGAELFATRVGLEIVDPSYFWTLQRWNELKKALEEEEKQKRTGRQGSERPHGVPHYGTVGAVALDRAGNLAAGTSTGGMTNKRPGRIGDSPIVGAGTYADNEACGVSATGHGEFFIRYAVAHDIVALMKYKGLSVEKAADLVINDKLRKVGGEGGVIALDSHGHVAMPFNSEGMYRGYITQDGTVQLAIYEK
jgi:beta-aspartyl-peptidase (threonine type)